MAITLCVYFYVKGGTQMLLGVSPRTWGGCQTEQEMNTLLTAAWLSYTLGSAPVALFDGRVPEHGWEICSTSQAPITVYDGPRERSSVGLSLEYRDGSGWCYSTWPGYHMTDPITV